MRINTKTYVIDNDVLIFAIKTMIFWITYYYADQAIFAIINIGIKGRYRFSLMVHFTDFSRQQLTEIHEVLFLVYKNVRNSTNQRPPLHAQGPGITVATTRRGFTDMCRWL
jgi:hypothetical protein